MHLANLDMFPKLFLQKGRHLNCLLQLEHLAFGQSKFQRVISLDIALLTCSPIYHVQVRNYFGSSRYKVVLNDLE